MRGRKQGVQATVIQVEQQHLITQRALRVLKKKHYRSCVQNMFRHLHKACTASYTDLWFTIRGLFELIMSSVLL